MYVDDECLRSGFDPDRNFRSNSGAGIYPDDCPQPPV
jgi:hypothetical protein